MMPTTHHHPLMKTSIKLMSFNHCSHKSIHMKHYPLHWASAWVEVQNIHNPLTTVGKVTVVLYFPTFSPSASTVWDDTTSVLHDIWICAMSPITEQACSSHLPLCASVCVSITFQENTGWRTEGNRNLHTREHLKLINAYDDHPKTSNIYYRLTFPNATKGIKLSTHVENK